MTLFLEFICILVIGVCDLELILIGEKLWIEMSNVKVRPLSVTLGTSIRKYAYHWQDSNGKLITRWDNAPDWDVATFPHHKHVGQDNVVEPSFERTLEQVLAYIRNCMNTSL
jgi:hypothetical protein